MMKEQTERLIRSCTPAEQHKWDFAGVPEKELRQCYLYEYCLEIAEVVEEVRDFRRRQKNVKQLEAKARLWEILHPLSPEKSPEASAQRFLQFCDENADLMAAQHTRLADPAAFLLTCRGFPQRHWQELPQTGRTARSRYAVVDLDLTGKAWLAKRKLKLVRPPEIWDLLSRRRPKKPGERWDLTEDDGWTETIAVRLNWNRSTTELSKDFAVLLERELRGGRVPFQKTSDVSTRTPPPKSALKKLAAARLLKAFEDALRKGREVNDSAGDPIELYSEPSDWRKAARGAEAIRRKLADLLLRRETPGQPSATVAIPVDEAATREVGKATQYCVHFGLLSPFLRGRRLQEASPDADFFE